MEVLYVLLAFLIIFLIFVFAYILVNVFAYSKTKMITEAINNNEDIDANFVDSCANKVKYKKMLFSSGYKLKKVMTRSKRYLVLDKIKKQTPEKNETAGVVVGPGVFVGQTVKSEAKTTYILVLGENDKTNSSIKLECGAEQYFNTEVGSYITVDYKKEVYSKK